MSRKRNLLEAGKGEKRNDMKRCIVITIDQLYEDVPTHTHTQSGQGLFQDELRLLGLCLNQKLTLIIVGVHFVFEKNNKTDKKKKKRKMWLPVVFLLVHR